MLAAVLAATLAKAVWIQAVRAESLARKADAQHRETVIIPASRGLISDRNGVELARDEVAITISADPFLVKAPAREAARAATVLGLSGSEQTALVGALSDKSKRFVYVKRQVSVEKARKLKRMKLAGFQYADDEKRVYPLGAVAAQVLGFAGVDKKGLAGIELSYDRDLRGQAGEKTVIKDPSGDLIEVLQAVDEKPGTNITLSIDSQIQLEAERVLRETVQSWQARSATATVLDPNTGEVLAMATAPGYDANRFSDIPQAYWRNRAVTDDYEPGSTFKLVTVAGVLAENLVAPTTEFTLPYEIPVADKQIHDAHPRGTERMSVAEILSRSSNVGAVTLSQKLGQESLARWIKRFGFGERTGIDYPGENSGRVPPPKQWYGSTAGTVPIGQGITVTPLQLASAYAAIANGGVWVEPRLTLRVDGKRAKEPTRRRVVTPVVATQLMSMLRDVVDEGTGTQAEIAGYTVAGKTGTAAKAIPGGYSDYRYEASFVGIVPASKPRLVILVNVDEPRGSIWGSVVAAPAFKELALSCLQYLEVPPDKPS